jgi:hypothetical protein
VLNGLMDVVVVVVVVVVVAVVEERSVEPAPTLQDKKRIVLKLLCRLNHLLFPVNPSPTGQIPSRC